MFHCHFLFFNKRRISTLISLFSGEMFKVVVTDYQFIGRASFITSFENRSVERLSRSRQATPWRYLYTNVLVSNFSLPLPSSEVPLNFYSNGTYLVMTLLLSST